MVGLFKIVTSRLSSKEMEKIKELGIIISSPGADESQAGFYLLGDDGALNRFVRSNRYRPTVSTSGTYWSDDR